MSKMKNLSDLLLFEGRQLYNSCSQEMEMLPKIISMTNSKPLKKIIHKQLELAESQKEHIVSAFKKLETEFNTEKCKTTAGIFNRLNYLIRHTDNKATKDAAIISSLQQLSHRKIAGFGTVKTYAMHIGQKFVAIYFHKALETEIKIDDQLTSIAKNDVNIKALRQTRMT